MTGNVTHIKLFGPQIPQALQLMEELTTDIQKGQVESLKGRITVGRYFVGELADFEFIWAQPPQPDEVVSLAHQIDQILTTTNCPARYSLTTPSPIPTKEELPATAFTYFKIIGPFLAQAIRILEKNFLEYPGIKTATGALLGTYDFAFEWQSIPDIIQIVDLLEEVDRKVLNTGILYQVATKSRLRVRGDSMAKEKASIRHSQLSMLTRSTPPKIILEST